MKTCLDNILRDLPLPVLDALIISLGHAHMHSKIILTNNVSIEQAEEMIRLNISHAIMSGVEGDLNQQAITKEVNLLLSSELYFVALYSKYPFPVELLRPNSQYYQ